VTTKLHIGNMPRTTTIQDIEGPDAALSKWTMKAMHYPQSIDSTLVNSLAGPLA
jgi:hypothetical protein